MAGDAPPPFPVRVVRHRSRGRELATTAACARGTVLLRNLPFALVPCDAQLSSLCARCLSGDARLTACRSACGLHLCAACAADPSWNAVHLAGECVSLRCLWQLLGTTPGGGVDESAGLRLLLRVTYTLHVARAASYGAEGDDDIDGDAVSDGPDSLDALLTHWDSLSDAAAAAAEGLAATARSLLLSVARESRESLALAAAKLACNSFDLVDAETGTSLAEGLYPSIASCINHSCAPNADFVVEAGKNAGALAIRALRPLEAGERITIAYCNLFTAAKKRRAHLRETYHFTCRCPRCVGGADAPHVQPLAGALRDALPLLGSAAGKAAVASAAAALAAAVEPLVAAGDDWARLTLARAQHSQLVSSSRSCNVDAAKLAHELSLLLGDTHPFAVRARSLIVA